MVSHRGPRAFPAVRVCPTIRLDSSHFDPCLLSISYGLQMSLMETIWSPHMARHVQVGSAASLEWTVVGLTSGPIRGCLKPPLELVFLETRWALLCCWGCQGEFLGRFRLGAGVDHGAAGKGGCIGGMDGRWLSWSPKSSLMGQHRMVEIAPDLAPSWTP